MFHLCKLICNKQEALVDDSIMINRIVFMLIFWDTKIAACIDNCRNMWHVKIANGQVRVYESGISDSNCTTSSHNGYLLYRSEG